MGLMAKVLSLFDGISCGMVAFERAGIYVSEYHACEIDKYAIKISQANYSDIIRHGSVVDYHPDRSFDYVIGGSPCQGFSFAGKQLAFDDPRSSLFFEYVRILKACREINPDIKFLLENVKMKKEHLAVITDILGVQPVLINSALISAQNRQRYYWCNWPVSQPADRGFLLRDIIEHGAVDREKSLCVTSRVAGATQKRYLKKNHHQMVIKVCNVNPSGNGMNGWVYSTDGKAPTVTTNKGEGTKITGGAIRGRYEPDGTISQRLEINGLEKANAITTVGKDSVLVTDSITCRKLTPIECERLQTLPDNYTAAVSNSQRYKALGNGWTVDVIAHILSESING